MKCKYCIGELFFINSVFLNDETKVTFYQCKHCKMLDIRIEKVML